MDNDRDRVCFSVGLGATVQEIVVSRAVANEFVEQFKTGGEIVEISGVCDHRDANSVELILRREAIDWIVVQEIKV
jgi:hypothetical protein